MNIHDDALSLVDAIETASDTTLKAFIQREYASLKDPSVDVQASAMRVVHRIMASVPLARQMANQREPDYFKAVLTTMLQLLVKTSD